MRRWGRRAVAVAAAVLLGAAPAAAQSYYAYACAESDDTVALVRFTPSARGGAIEVVKTIPVGSFPADIEGPHGIAVHPNGRTWYVSISHGQPFGTVHKFETETDEWLGDVRVGLFPASMDISRTTGLLYVVNFNLYGDMAPSSVSVVETRSMSEVAQVPTGIMPHGSRLDSAGRHQYHTTMMDDHLVEVDALTFEVKRKLALSEHGGHAMHADHMAMGEPASPEAAAAEAAARKEAMARLVQPTWATQPTRDGKLYVMGNNTNVIVEVDVARWEVTRRFEGVHNGPYNADVTPDGKTLIVTYKKGAAVGIWDLETGKEAARITTTRTVPHGVVITPDSKYAFVTNEGVGGEPGAVEVYDLATRARVAAVDVGKQAGGIAFWKVQ